MPPAKCTRSWGRTARARARSPRCSPAARATGHRRAACCYDGRDLLALPPEERARAGVFLAFQYPVEIPGVNNAYLLKAALNAQRRARGEPELDAFEFLKLVREQDEAHADATRASLRARQRGILRRREEAQRDPADGCCSSRSSPCSTRPTPASTSTRCEVVADGVNSAAHRRRGRCCSSPTTSGCSIHRAGPRARAGRRPHRAIRRQANWRSSSSSAATTGCRRSGDGVTARLHASSDAIAALPGAGADAAAATPRARRAAPRPAGLQRRRERLALHRPRPLAQARLRRRAGGARRRASCERRRSARLADGRCRRASCSSTGISAATARRDAAARGHRSPRRSTPGGDEFDSRWAVASRPPSIRSQH